MNLKIELTDLPEFERDLEISICLKKDNGKVVGETKISSATSTVTSIGDINVDLKKTEKIEKVSKSVKGSKKAGDGNSDIPSKLRDNLSNDSTPKTLENKNQSASQKSKFSGNLMGLEF